MSKKKNRIDILIIAALLLVSLTALGIMYLTRETGGYAVVSVDGRETARYSLKVDGRYELNGGTNVLCISEGKAWMEWADCPDHICIKQGRVSYTGQSICCLPNRLIVTVEGGAEDGVDAVVS